MQKQYLAPRSPTCQASVLPLTSRPIPFRPTLAAALLTLLLSHLLPAQTLPGSYTTSWAGNSLVPASAEYNSVQNWANSMFVADDGTIYANANWDESAKELGIYRNGQAIGIIPNQHTHADGGAITVNASYIWASVHSGKVQRFDKTTLAEAGIEWQASTDIIRGLAATATQLFLSDFAGGSIKVYDASSSTLVRSWSVTRPGPLALDGAGNLWVLTYLANAYGPGNTVYCYSPTGTLLKTVTMPAGVEAKSIAVDKVRNELLVTDIGDNMQVHLYNNINTTPTFAQSFGVQGGILSGTRGLVAPLKFNVPSLVGVDGAGNLIVWSNGNNPDPRKTVDYDGMGTCLESYTRAGVRNWQLLGLEFVDMGTFDPATDGADLYTKHEHFTMDYTKPDGQQWTWKGWTLDRKTYADSDKRLRNDGGHLSGVVMRRLEGQKFLYVSNMSGGGYSIYRFTDTDEIAVPCGSLLTRKGWTDTNANGQEDAGETTGGMNWLYDMFATCVDKKGDIWYAFDDIRKHSLQGVVNGVPVYDTDTPTSITAKPAPFNDVRRVEYDSDNDVMYVTGYTAALPYAGDWKSTGRVLARYNNWSTGNRTPLYTVNLPSEAAGSGANMVSIAIEKDYLFVVGVQTRGKVWVYRSADGQLAGTMVPGSNIGGVSRTGWCDMVNSVAAFRRSTGEYLVTVEDDGWAKVIIYRWSPGAAPVAPVAQIVDDAAPGWTWSKFPAYANITGPYANTEHGGYTKGASGRYTFTGTAVDLYCWKGIGGATMEIFIDNVSRGTVSLSSPVDDQFQQKVFTATGLTAAAHTLKIVSRNTGWAEVDYISYLPVASGARAGTPLAPAPESAPLRVYPNPTSTRLHVQLPGGEVDGAAVALVDAVGRPVFSATLSGVGEAELDVSALPQGLYFLEVQTATARKYRRKVFIQRQ